MDMILLLAVLYLLLIRGYFLSRRKFRCLRCGNCCKLRVKLNKREIDLIEKNGHRDFMNKGCIKRINGYCNFLTLKNGITSCQIENIKPEICKDFPLKKGFFGRKVDGRCKVYENKLF